MTCGINYSLDYICLLSLVTQFRPQENITTASIVAATIMFSSSDDVTKVMSDAHDA